MKTPPLCKDCKYCDKSLVVNDYLWSCNKYQPKIIHWKTSPLTGEKSDAINYHDLLENRVYERCTYQRENGWLGARLYNRCGKEGRFFQQIPT
jgi:hypothetical protein